MNNIYDDIKILDNLLICEGVSASIIENYDIIGMYLCTQCGDEIKNGDNTSKEDVIRHQPLAISYLPYEPPDTSTSYEPLVDRVVRTLSCERVGLSYRHLIPLVWWM